MLFVLTCLFVVPDISCDHVIPRIPSILVPCIDVDGETYNPEPPMLPQFGEMPMQITYARGFAGLDLYIFMFFGQSHLLLSAVVTSQASSEAVHLLH